MNKILVLDEKGSELKEYYRYVFGKPGDEVSGGSIYSQVPSFCKICNNKF